MSRSKKRRYKRKFYLLVMVMMGAVNTNQVVAVWNPVAKWPIIAVLKQGCFAGVRVVTIHMTTAEAKPKMKIFIFRKLRKISKCISKS